MNVSSGIGLIGMPFCSTYAATKAGIAHFGEALRPDLYGEGVHVLNVYPGARRHGPHCEDRLNLKDPAAVDSPLFARKGPLEEAVAAHSSL